VRECCAGHAEQELKVRMRTTQTQKRGSGVNR